MKKIAFLLLISLFQFTMNAQKSAKPSTKAKAKTPIKTEVSKPEVSKSDIAKPAFKFETEELDYGTIKKNADGVRFFKFKNIGNAPLIIEDVKGSCGCTIPTKPSEPIMPGKSGEIKVKYATDRVGAFIKTVTIVSNATDMPKVVKIKGEVTEN